MTDINQDNIRITDKLFSLPEKTKHDRDHLVPSTPTMKIDEIVTLQMPAVDLSELPTREVAQVVAVSFPSSDQLLNNTWNVEQSTWMLPVAPGPAKANQPGQTSATSQDYFSLALNIIKSSGIYAIGAFASPLVSLILTPFLTHTLSNSNYGGLIVLYSVIDFMTIITQFGLGVAFFRAYNGDYESPQDRLSILSASIILLSLISIPIVIGMMITAPWLSILLFNSPSFSNAIKLTALVIIAENLTLPGLSWLRAENRAVFYTILSIANMLLILGTNLIMVGTFHMGVDGALLAKGAGYAVIVIGTFPVMLVVLIRRKNFNLRFDILWNMLLFGAPTIFGDLAKWVLQLSDRFLLSHFGSLAQAASYSIADSLGGVLTPLFLAPFGLAWIPIMYTIAKKKDATRLFTLVFRWFSSIAFFGTFAVILLSTVILKVFFPPSYHSAALLIPVIALSEMSLSIYYFFALGVLLRKKTILEFIYMLIGAAVNLGLNLFFIPQMGAMGAAISTLLAYIVIISLAYIVNQKIYPVKFEIGFLIIRLFVGIALYVGSNFLAQTQKPLISWSISVGTLILYGIFLMALGGLSPKKLKKTIGSIREGLVRKGRIKMHE